MKLSRRNANITININGINIQYNTMHTFYNFIDTENQEKTRDPYLLTDFLAEEWIGLSGFSIETGLNILLNMSIYYP